MAATKAPSNGKVDAAAGSVAVRRRTPATRSPTAARRASKPAVAAGAAAAGLRAGC